MESTVALNEYVDVSGQMLPVYEYDSADPDPAQNSVGSETSHVRAITAVSRSRRRRSASRAGGRVGSPRTWVMATPRTTRGTPRLIGMAATAETKATGMPARSSSIAIVAPQRLHVPQVAVMMAAATPSRVSWLAISRPNRRACAAVVPTPTVT